jgi:hypothetical protein
MASFITAALTLPRRARARSTQFRTLDVPPVAAACDMNVAFHVVENAEDGGEVAGSTGSRLD